MRDCGTNIQEVSGLGRDQRGRNPLFLILYFKKITISIELKYLVQHRKAQRKCFRLLATAEGLNEEANNGGAD